MSELENLRAEVVQLRKEQNFLLASILAAVQQGVWLQEEVRRGSRYDSPRPLPPIEVRAADFAERGIAETHRLNMRHTAHLDRPACPSPGIGIGHSPIVSPGQPG